MFYSGVLLVAITTLLYPLRNSFSRDLSYLGISRYQISFYTRLFTIPLIAILIMVSNVNILVTDLQFYLWLSVALLVSFLFEIHNLHCYKKYKFSWMANLSFLGILFSVFSSMLIFGEKFSFTQLMGITMAMSAIGLLLLFGNDKKGILSSMPDIVLVNLLSTAANTTAAKTILMSSPLVYVFYVSIGLVAINLFISLKTDKMEYRLQDKNANWIILLLSAFSALSFLGNSYGLKTLPLGIASTVAVSVFTFSSLWLSHHKYKEGNFRQNIFASSVALVGTALILVR